MTDVPFVYIVIVTVTEYLAVQFGSVPRNWSYGHLKQTMSQSVNYNNIGPQLTRVVGVVCDAFTACGHD